MNQTRIFITLFVLLLCFLSITHICEALTVETSELSRSWKPEASTADNSSIAWFTVSVSGITSGDHYKRVEISLKHVSEWMGTCCNSTDTGTDPDLKFLTEDNPRWEVVNQHLLRWEIPSNGDLPDPVELSVGVRSFDYAASGELYGAVYKEKGIFRKEWKPDTSAIVSPGFRQIPIDKNYNGIADSWSNDWNAATDSGNDFRDVDVDNMIGSQHTGDNLRVLEEYRGFMTKQENAGGSVRIEHIRTSPFSKDLFVVNEDSRTTSHRTGNGPPLSLHTVDQFNVDGTGVVDFNNSGDAYSVRIESNTSYTIGDRYGAVLLGPPIANHTATIYVNKIRLDFGSWETIVIKDTIGHELGHCVHLRHCPELADHQGNSWSNRCLMWESADVSLSQNQYASHHQADYSLTTANPVPQQPVVIPRSTTPANVISTNTGSSSYGCDHNSEYDYCSDIGTCGSETDSNANGLCGHRWCLCPATDSSIDDSSGDSSILSTNTGVSDTYGCDYVSEYDYCSDTGNCGSPTESDGIGLCGHRYCLCAADSTDDSSIDDSSEDSSILSTNTGVSDTYGCDYMSEYDYCSDTGNCGSPTGSNDIGLCGHRYCLCAAAY